jgi:O-antigen/teichoic acid export membrane protein
MRKGEAGDRVVTAPTVDIEADLQERRSEIRRGFAYAAAHYIAGIITAVSGFVVRIWVPPAVFGATSLVLAVKNYFRAYDGLYRSAIDREVPIHLRGDDVGGAEAIRRTAYRWLTRSLVVESVLLAAAGLLSPAPLVRIAFWVYAVINLLDGVTQADRITLKATQRFGAHNRALTTSGFLAGVVLIALSFAAGTSGYFAGLLGGAAISFVFFRRHIKPLGAKTGKAVPEGPWLKRVLHIGGLIALLKLSQEILFTVDRFVLVRVAGLEELGYYSLGLALAARIYLLPQSFVGSFAPTLNGLVGTGDTDQAGAIVQRLQRMSAALAFLTCGGVILALPPLIAWALPDYSGAVPGIQVLVFGAYWMAINATGVQVHVAFARVRPAVFAALLAVPVSVGAAYALSAYGAIGVAFGRVAALGLYAVLLDWSARRLLNRAGLVFQNVAGAVGLFAVLMAALFWSPWPALAAYVLLGALAGHVLLDHYNTASRR